eukprot:6620574-Prymnesium_polylepis.1
MDDGSHRGDCARRGCTACARGWSGSGAAAVQRRRWVLLHRCSRGICSYALPAVLIDPTWRLTCLVRVWGGGRLAPARAAETDGDVCPAGGVGWGVVCMARRRRRRRQPAAGTEYSLDLRFMK